MTAPGAAVMLYFLGWVKIKLFSKGERNIRAIAGRM
jgi:hypothetical protein